jgi:hypothetical protein
MGDRSRVNLYSELLGFLESRGRSLSEFGSHERGLDIQDAKAFLHLLSSNDVPVLGIEVWRSANGWLAVDGWETWYSIKGESIRDNHLSASRYLAGIKVGANDVLAIQFG